MSSSRPIPDDAALVARARRGEAAAFETLVRCHYRAAFAVALAVLGNRMDAEDVCQDAFVVALERLEDCRQPDRFAAWLLQVVRNRARNYRDYRRVRAAAPLDVHDVADTADASREAARSELRALLDGALEALSERQREVVLLHDLEGWDHRAIARALGISEVMSRQHLFVARRALRARLGPTIVRDYTSD